MPIINIFQFSKGLQIEGKTKPVSEEAIQKVIDVEKKKELGWFNDNDAFEIASDAIYSDAHRGPQNIKEFEPTPLKEVDDLNSEMFNQDLVNVLSEWTTTGYKQLSEFFRKSSYKQSGEVQLASESAEKLQQLFSMVGDYTNISYRGGTLKYTVADSLQEGELLRTKAPISSSKSEQMAVDYAFNAYHTRDDLLEGYDLPVVYVIDNKHRAQYDIQQYAAIPEEREVLIANNTLFQIEGIEARTDAFGRQYKEVKLSSKYNHPKLLHILKNSPMAAKGKINEKALSFVALALAIGGSQQEAEAHPLSTITSGNISNTLAGYLERQGQPRKGFDPYIKNLSKLGQDPHAAEPEVVTAYKKAVNNFAKQTKIETGISMNIVSATNRFFDETSNKDDADWLAFGRKEWLERNEAYMSPEMKEAIYEQIEEGGLNNPDLMTGYVNRHTAEEAAAERLYKDGFWSGLGIDALTGTLQPADLALSLITLGGYKYYTTTKAAIKAWSTYHKLGAGALSSAAFAVASEESRQYLGGFDLNNTGMVALFGATLGTSFTGLGMGWQRLQAHQQQKHLKNVAKIYLEQMDWSKTPPVEDIEISGTPGVPGGSIVWNPSPLIALYSAKKDYLYPVLSKIAPSFVTLRDDLGNPVIQTEKNAFEITNNLLEADYKGFETKMQGYQNESGLDKLEFSETVTTTVRAQAELHKQKAFEIKTLEDIKEEKIKTLEDIKEEKIKAEEDITEIDMKIEEDITEIDVKIEEVKSREVEIIETDSPAVNKALKETQDFFGRYNDKIKDLEIEHHKKSYPKEEDFEIPEKFVVAVEKWEQRAKEVETTYKDRHLRYFPRYWNTGAVYTNEGSVDIVKQALLNSSEAKALQLHNPDKYKEFIDALDEYAQSHVDKLRAAESNIDILNSEKKVGQGDITKGKSDIGRRMDVADVDVLPLVRSDIFEVTHAYAHDMGHKLGFREAFNVKNFEELKTEVIDSLKVAINNDTALTPRERKNMVADLDVAFETISGIRYLADTPNSGFQTFKRSALGVNNALYGAGMGELVLSELGTAWKVGGRDTIKGWSIGMKKAVADYRKLGHSTEELESMLDAFDGIALGTSVVHSNIERRLGDGTFYKFEEGETFGQKTVEGINKIATAGFHIGGMNFLTTSLQYATAYGLMARTHRIGGRLAAGGKLSTSEKASFARWGLDEEDAQNIFKQPRLDDNGDLNLNMTGWNQKAKEDMLRAMHRGAKEAVLQDSPLALPRVFSDTSGAGAIMNVVLQYTKHPTMAYNMLIKNGYNDKDARAIGGALFSFGMLTSAVYWREQIMIQLGMIDEDKAKYDLDKEEGIDKLLLYAASRVPQLSHLSKIVDVTAAIAGYENFQTGWKDDPVYSIAGPTPSTAKRVFGLISDSIEEEKPSPKILRMLPIINSWPLTEDPMKKLHDHIDYKGWTDD